MTDYTIRVRLKAKLPNRLRSADIALIVSDVCSNVIRCIAQTEATLSDEVVLEDDVLAAATALVMKYSYEQAVELVGGELHGLAVDIEED